MAFIDEMRAEGNAVEPICRVLREQGCQIAARTYRTWSQPAQAVAARKISDAIVEDKVRDLVWTIDELGRRQLTEADVTACGITLLTDNPVPGTSGVASLIADGRRVVVF